MSWTTPEKAKPKQLRPFALIVALIELGLAIWVYRDVVLRAGNRLR